MTTPVEQKMDKAEMLSKEEREEMLNRKIEQMRKKNEELLKKHERKEADRLEAERSGCAVSARLRPQSPPLRHPDNVDEDWDVEVQPKYHKQTDNVKTPVRDTARRKQMSTAETQKFTDRRQVLPAGDAKAADGADNRRLSSSDQGPPADPAYNFLSDDFRDGPVNSGRQKIVRTSRNRHTYGGDNFNNVVQTMEAAKHKHNSALYRQPDKMMYVLTTTGSERRQYEEWKEERERIDKERIERQKNADGLWKREWDNEKLSGQAKTGEVTKNVSEMPKRPGVNHSQKDEVTAESRNKSPSLAGSVGRGRGRGRARPRPGAEVSSGVGLIANKSPRAEVISRNSLTGSEVTTGDGKSPSDCVTERLPRTPKYGRQSLESKDSRSISKSTESHKVRRGQRLVDAHRDRNLKESGREVGGHQNSSGTSEDSEQRLRQSIESVSNIESSAPSATEGNGLKNVRRLVDGSEEKIIISICNARQESPSPSVQTVGQKAQKIGSGRLGKPNFNSGRVQSGRGNKRWNSGTGRERYQKNFEEEPVTIGVAVITTPGERQPTDQAVSLPPPKSILKQRCPEPTEDWDKELIEELDWDKEVKEAQLRKKMETSPPVVPKSGVETVDKTPLKKTGHGKQTKDQQSHEKHVVDDNDDDDEWEDVDEVDDDDDVLSDEGPDISRESFEQFIEKHTLKLDIITDIGPVGDWSTKDPTGGSTTPMSQDSFLKTPTGYGKVLDWGAEMDELSQNENKLCAVVEDCTTLSDDTSKRKSSSPLMEFLQVDSAAATSDVESVLCLSHEKTSELASCQSVIPELVHGSLIGSTQTQSFNLTGDTDSKLADTQYQLPVTEINAQTSHFGSDSLSEDTVPITESSPHIDSTDLVGTTDQEPVKDGGVHLSEDGTVPLTENSPHTGSTDLVGTTDQVPVKDGGVHLSEDGTVPLTENSPHTGSVDLVGTTDRVPVKDGGVQLPENGTVPLTESDIHLTQDAPDVISVRDAVAGTEPVAESDNAVCVAQIDSN